MRSSAGAQSGKIGDGKIWVSELSTIVRIRTGERNVGRDLGVRRLVQTSATGLRDKGVITPPYRTDLSLRRSFLA